MPPGFGPNGAPDGSSHGPVPLDSRSHAPRPPVPEASSQPANRPPPPAVRESAAPPAYSAPARALSPPPEPRSPPASPEAATGAIPPRAPPRSSDDFGQPSSDTPTADGASRSEPSTSLESATSAEPSTRVAPASPVAGETQVRGSILTVMRDAVEPAKAVQSGRIQTAPEVAPALYTAHSRVATSLAAGARGRQATASPNDVAPLQPWVRAAVSAGGPSAGSSSSSGAGPLGLISALMLIFLLHWSAVLLVPERWRPAAFFARPERPG